MPALLRPDGADHQAYSQKIQPRMVATIGPSGVGKTVYPGMLIDMLSRQTTGMQLLGRGAFSINLQQLVIGALSRCQFPNKTPNEPSSLELVTARFLARQQRQPIELVMPDMAGEAILEEVDHPYSFPIIRTFLKKCAGIMLLIDTTKVVEGTLDQDDFTMKLLSYLNELDDDRQTGWTKRPVALVFTKVDECRSACEAPVQFAQLHTPGLWQQARERFTKHQFFAAGVAGGTAMVLDGRRRDSSAVASRAPRHRRTVRMARQEPRKITRTIETPYEY